LANHGQEGKALITQTIKNPNRCNDVAVENLKLDPPKSTETPDAI
jgi:hypothetical protein